MKNAAILFGLILFSIQSILAQSYDISGQIKDENTGQALLYSYVHVLNESDSLILSAVSDEKGFFNIPLKPGNYKFNFSQLGYREDTTTLYTVRQSQFLDVFKLSPNDTELEEVTVEATSDKYYFDRDEQIITSELKKDAADTYDVLDKVNGLHFDRYNDNISVDNDDNVVLLVNSLEKDISYIKNIAPERLKKVEIIRSPSGKYALEGYSAVINVILKDDYRGTDLSYSNHAFMNFIKFPKRPLMIDNNNFSANFSNGNYNSYMNYNYAYQGFVIPLDIQREYSDGSFESFNPPENLASNNGRMKNKEHKISGGIDYFLSPKHSISYEISYRSRRPEDNYLHGLFSVTNNFQGDTVVNSMENLREEGYTTLNNSVFYNADFNSRNKLKVSYALSLHKGEINNIRIWNQYTNAETTYNDRSYSVLNAEYNHIFSDRLQADLTYGMISDSRENSFLQSSENIIGEETGFDYRDMRHNASGYLTFHASEKITLKAGAAFENSVVKREEISNTEKIFLPHADISYKPADFLQMTLKYRARANYPSINQINPFAMNDFDNITMKGNPDLIPEIENNISLRMNILSGLISLEPYYRFTENYIISVVSEGEQGNITSQYQNAAESKQSGLRANLNIPIPGNIIFQNSVDLYKQSITYREETRSLKDMSMTSNLIYRSPKHGGMIGLMYQNLLCKHLTWEGYRFTNNDYWAVMAQKSFLKNQLTVMMLYMLPFEWGATFNQGSYAQTEYYTEYNNINIDALKNMLMFRISYRFSKGQKNRTVEKSIDLDEQRGSGLF